jgi:hypothetical protein
LLGLCPEGPCEEPPPLLGFCPEGPCEEPSPEFSIEQSSHNTPSLKKKSKPRSIDKRLKKKEVKKRSKLSSVNVRSLKIKKVNI